MAVGILGHFLRVLRLLDRSVTGWTATMTTKPEMAEGGRLFER